MDLATLADRLEYVSAGYADEFGVARTEEWILLKLTEEVGELVQAHLSATGQGRDRGMSREEHTANVGEELADVISMCLVLAKRLDIDVERAIDDKWGRHERGHRARGFELPSQQEGTPR